MSYYDMQLYVLKLVPPASPAELPRPLGEPRQITRSGPWHVNDPAWTPDGRALIYTRSTYAGDIYVTENYF